ncbi:MAG: response regulator transcription factor [Bacteroidales bacterium]|jgi:DNA-binding NarL/FixJ family response regulator|nr:response regulator transcription factor [Bacteroidales bacterium]
MAKTSVFVCDAQQLFCDGIRSILSENGYAIVGDALTGKDLVKKVQKAQPEIILMDVTLPELNGYEAAKQILALFPHQIIVVISERDDEKIYTDCMTLGVRGYILKNATKNELLLALQKITNGDIYFSQSLLLKIIKTKNTLKSSRLSIREKEVLQLICNGDSNNEISEKLHISPRTVERHRANLLRKTDSSNSIKLAMHAVQHGLIEV